MGLDALDAAPGATLGARQQAQNAVGRHQAGFAFDGHRLPRLELELAAYMQVGILRDQHAARQGCGLDLLDGVDRLTDGGEFTLGAQLTKQHGASVDADAHGQAA